MKTERYLDWQGLDSLDIIYTAWSVIFFSKPVVCLEMAHVMEILIKIFQIDSYYRMHFKDHHYTRRRRKSVF